MFELLPENQKKTLKKDYFFRLATVILASVLVLSAFFAVLLLPSYFLSAVKEKAVSEEFDLTAKSKNIQKEQELQLSIRKSKEMLDILKTGEDKISIKDLIFKIVEKKNSGIVIDGFLINLSKNNKYEILITGTAQKRDNLKIFAENLRSSKEFDSIDLPISNFAKVADIDFSIMLKSSN